MIHPIRVYCPNLANRLERRRHIESESKDRPESALSIDARIKTYNDTRKLFLYDQSKGYYSFQPNEPNY